MFESVEDDLRRGWECEPEDEIGPVGFFVVECTLVSQVDGNLLDRWDQSFESLPTVGDRFIQYGISFKIHSIKGSPEGLKAVVI